MFVICAGKCWLHVLHVLTCPDVTSTHISRKHILVTCWGTHSCYKLMCQTCVFICLVACWGQVFIIMCPAQQPSVLSHVVPHSSQVSEVLRHMFCLMFNQTWVHVSGHHVFSHVLQTPAWSSVLTCVPTHLTWSRSVFWPCVIWSHDSALFEQVLDQFWCVSYHLWPRYSFSHSSSLSGVFLK